MRARTMQIICLMGLLVVLGGCASTPAAQGTLGPGEVGAVDPPPFCCHGKPIHPAVVELLDLSIGEPPPAIVAIDVDAALHRERNTPMSEIAGFLSYSNLSRHGEGGFGAGYFMYRHLGCTSDGIHVVQTASSGGGSGVFMNLLFLRFEIDRSLEEGVRRSRLLLRRVGEVSLGDRYEGALRLENNRLLIGASRDLKEPRSFDLGR